MRHWQTALGLVLLLAGLAPVLLPLLSALLASQIDGCAANEAGSVNCIVNGQDYGPLLAAPYRLLPIVPAGFLASLAGFGVLLAGWSARRAATRRAKHR